jgi:hypothetical protein
VNGIKFIFTSNKEVEAARPIQEKRFSNGHTVSGTRENHHFVPIDHKQICISRVSTDTLFFTTYIDQSAETSFEYVPVANVQPGQYVACIYDNSWWIGNICEISVQEHDALINFLHPHGIARSFHWPTRQDTCWIHEQQIIAQIPVPTAARMGRQCSLPESIVSSINDKFQLFKQWQQCIQAWESGTYPI